jgi:hypothetical protein
VAETELRIELIGDAAGIDRFIKVPFALYADDPHWVAPLNLERRDHLNPKSNPYFDHAEVAYWLALRGGRAVGRISAQVDRAYLERHNDGCGHFGFIEGIDDGAVFKGLFAAAEGWLAERGMVQVRGPFSLSINDESGLLVEGFDSPPSMMMGHAPPYYAGRIEAEGYSKAKDLFAYRFDRGQSLPAGPSAIIKRARRSNPIKLRHLDKRRYQADLDIILDIFNDAWSNNWGFVPFTAAEIKHMAKSMKPLISEKLVSIVEVDGEPAAMAVSLPNLNEAIADLDGALLPFGWAKLLWRLKIGPLRSARVLLMGVRKKYHDSPLGAALAFTAIDAIYRDLTAAGFDYAELSWVLEDNLPMRRIIDVCGARHYKTYRIYEKALT